MEINDRFILIKCLEGDLTDNPNEIPMIVPVRDIGAITIEPTTGVTVMVVGGTPVYTDKSISEFAKILMTDVEDDSVFEFLKDFEEAPVSTAAEAIVEGLMDALL